MQCTGYYRILEHQQNDIADDSDFLIVNCTGMNYKTQESFQTIASRPDFYLLYVTEGILSVCLSDSICSLKAGMGIIYYPNQQFHYHFDGTGANCYYWVHFTGFSAQHFLERFGFTNLYIFDIGVHSSIISLFDKIASEIMNRRENFVFASSTYLLQLLCNIKRYEIPNTSMKSRKRIENSINIMHTNYHTDLSIENLAATENMSPSYYRTVFREIVGCSPKQYLTNLRMRRACELLSQTQHSVESIGEMVGYKDMLYFYRIFKKNNGVTPSQYRIANKQLTEGSTPRSWSN